MGVTLLAAPTREKRPYRLRCRFKTDPYPSLGRIDREKVLMAERFVADMHKQGWEYVERFGFKMRGPLPMVMTMTLHPPRTRSAREMLPRLLRGEKIRDSGGSMAIPAPSLAASDWWEYELAGVFVREQILTELPDAHEEELR